MARWFRTVNVLKPQARAISGLVNPRRSGVGCSSGSVGDTDLAGGAAGGPGGRGGRGGKGSGGGGPAIGVAVAGGASASIDDATSFQLGDAGLDGDGMSAGIKADVYEQDRGCRVYRGSSSLIVISCCRAGIARTMGCSPL